MESKWKLYYNALENGWETKIFRRNCDNKNHTVTIIEKRPYIFGGYTDIPWGNNQNSFLCTNGVNSKMLEYDSLLEALFTTLLAASGQTVQFDLCGYKDLQSDWQNWIVKQQIEIKHFILAKQNQGIFLLCLVFCFCFFCFVFSVFVFAFCFFLFLSR